MLIFVIIRKIMNKTIFKDRNIIKSKIEDYLAKNAEIRFLHRLQILHYLAFGDALNIFPAVIQD